MTKRQLLERELEFVLPAISRPWRLHLNLSGQVELNGWFSAIKLIARISGPSQLRSFVFAQLAALRGCFP